MKTPKFLVQKGTYEQLLVFQKAECIYDVTYHFAHRFLERGDRTIDQMVQAARSLKQNIAEGNAASTTSREMELKLMGVAKASLQELLLDYRDYLRVRSLQEWGVEDQRTMQAREYCRTHHESADFRAALPARSDETIANIALVLLHQADLMLYRLIESLKEQFFEQGGIREELFRARRKVTQSDSK